SGVGELVQLAHYTVKEFLTSVPDPRPEISFFALEDYSSHYEIASACLTYLQFKHFTADRRLGRPEIEGGKFPFYDYAARFWHSHATFDGREENGVPQADSASSPEPVEARLLPKIMEFFAPVVPGNLFRWVAYVHSFGCCPTNRDKKMKSW